MQSVETISLFILVLITLASLGISCLIYVKLRNAHKLTYALDDSLHVEFRNLFSQLEALYALAVDPGYKIPLTGTRGWAASPDFLRILDERVHERRPQNVLEFGSGISTVVIARRLQKLGGGHLFSIDHDEYYADKTVAELVVQDLSEYVTVIIAPLKTWPKETKEMAEQAWYDLERLPQKTFDMVVVDGPPAVDNPIVRYFTLPATVDRLSASAEIILDDTDREGEQSIIHRWLKEYPYLTAEHKIAEKGCVILRVGCASHESE